MKFRLRRTPVFLYAIFAGILLSLGPFHVRSAPQASPETGPQRRAPKPSKHSDDPPAAAEFGAASNEPPTEVDNRRKREDRYRSVYPFIVDPGKEVNGAQETTHQTFYEFFGRPEPFPSSAVAVITGTVVSGQSHVSSGRTLVYSDYRVRVDQIWKPDSKAKLSLSGQVVAWRTGGSIHFPSGRLTHYIIMSQGFQKSVPNTFSS
jgi:hypothetical protein